MPLPPVIIVYEAEMQKVTVRPSQHNAVAVLQAAAVLVVNIVRRYRNSAQFFCAQQLAGADGGIVIGIAGDIHMIHVGASGIVHQQAAGPHRIVMPLILLINTIADMAQHFGFVAVAHPQITLPDAGPVQQADIKNRIGISPISGWPLGSIFASVSLI